MNKLFTWQWVLASLVVTVVTYVIVNGSVWGTAYLQALIPGVTIPDLKPNYSPHQLAGFFQAMGEEGRAAYVTVNNFDFLFILSNMSFGFIALGTMLRYALHSKRQATYFALLGVLPGLFDLIESVCFRVIVSSPYEHYPVLSTIAATSTNMKFIGYNLASLSLLILLIVIIFLRLKRQNKSVK